MSDQVGLEDHYAQMGADVFEDFRTVAVSRRALDLAEGDGRLVDVGCGVGVLVSYAWRDNRDVLGVDISDAQINRARSCFKVRELPVEILRHATVETLLEEEGGDAFSVATLLDVIEHVEHPVDLLSSVRQLLLPGGQVVISVPAHPEFFDARDKLIGHQRRYTPTMLVEHMKDADFDVDYVGYWNWLGWMHRKVGDLVDRGQATSGYGFRYSTNPLARGLNTVLKCYFLQVENRISPPIGLTLFATGRKRG